MNLRTRRRHLAMVLVGVPLVAGVLVSAYSVRPGENVTAFPPAMRGENAELQPWFESTSLFGELAVRVRIGEPRRLQLESDRLLGPTVLVYFQTGESESEGVEGALLLGSLAVGAPRDYLLPPDWEGGGRLLLYSLGHMEVVGRSSRLPVSDDRNRVQP